MLSPSAVKRYLDKELDDWLFVKNMSRRDFYQELEEIVPDFDFKTKPRKIQLACTYLGIYNDYFNYWLEQGIGKTKVVLDVIKLKRLMNGDLNKVLLVCPNEASYANWVDEVHKHSNFSITGLFGTRKRRLESLEEDKDIYCTNYEGLFTLFRKKANTVDTKEIKKIGSTLDCIVLDEIHLKCSSNISLTFGILNKLAKYVKYRYALTGTPFGKDPLKLWSQYNIIDLGETLETFTLFKAGFFREVPGQYGTSMEFKDKEKGRLHRRLQNKSIRYTLEEYKDAPPVIRDIVRVNWVEENKEYYNRAVEGYVESIKDKENFKVINNSFVKLRQISSGFLGFKNEHEEKLQIQFDSNPKLDMLEELILGIGEKHKIIIFNEYILSGHFIEERLKALKIKYTRLYGGTVDKQKARNDFLYDKDCRIFLVQNKSGGTSLNLQIAKYGIFYESPVACLDRKQCETRYTGARQKHLPAVMYDIVMKNSIEEKILESYKEGKDITDAVLDGKLKLQRI